MNLNQQDWKVLVFSKQYGCKLTQSIFKQNKVSFIFEERDKDQNNYKYQQNLINLLIIDQNQISQDQIEQKYGNSSLIQLKDTQKSVASIFALSGQLSTFGQNQKKQFVPFYVLDFIVGISLANMIFQIRKASKQEGFKERIIFKVSLIDLVKYYGAFNVSAKQNGLLEKSLGNNILDGGAPFYSLYDCSQGILAVGNLQPKFYRQMIKGMKFDIEKQQWLIDNQMNVEEWSKIRQIFQKQFKNKSAKQWQKQLQKQDTCVTQVVQKPNQNYKLDNFNSFLNALNTKRPKL